MPPEISNNDQLDEELISIDDPGVPDAIRSLGMQFSKPGRYVIDLGHGEYLLFAGDGELLDMCYLE